MMEQDGITVTNIVKLLEQTYPQPGAMRKQVRAQQLACFNCKHTFGPEDVESWDEKKAWCPECKLDSVVRIDNMKNVDGMLDVMHLYWFEKDGKELVKHHEMIRDIS